jgi:hypothetical protein
MSRSRFVEVYIDPLLYLLAAVSVTICLKSVTYPFETQHTDFLTFYDNARWYTSGHDLYSAPSRYYPQGPNLAPPVLMLLIVPLSPLPLTVARVAWMLFDVACFWLCIYWIAREVHRPTGRLFALLLISQPAFITILGGSFTAPLTVCLTRAWLEHRQSRDLSAGIWLGIAIVSKPFLLPFCGYAILRRHWRLCLGLASGVVAAVIGGIAVFGPTNTLQWVEALRAVAPHQIAYNLNGSWMGYLARANAPWSRFAWIVGSAAIALVLLWHWWRREHTDAAWIATVSGGLLISPLGWNYYAPFLIGPMVRRWSALSWVVYALFCLPLEPLAFVSMAPWWMLTIGSAAFWGYLLLFVASASDSRTPDRSAASHEDRELASCSTTSRNLHT